MSKHAKTIRMIEVAREILAELHPMTVRQVYYQLVSRQVIKNNRSQYQAVSRAVVDARKEGLIPWGWIEDRLRKPRSAPMWNDPEDFAECVLPQYRRDVWATQPTYFETWLEKDALAGIFEDVLEPYGVTLNVGRGFDGWSSIYNAAQRLDDDAAILYFGDFDPSGEDMVRSLDERLGELGSFPEIIKCALTFDDIEQYNLPPDPAKKTDTRSAAFIAKYGDISVELDALPVDVLRARLVTEVEARMDLEALRRLRKLEASERDAMTKRMTA